MSIEQPQKLTYLLHLWQVERDGELVWWASLENPRTGERQAFANLAALFAFLDERTVNELNPTGENKVSPGGETTYELSPPANKKPDLYLSYLLRLLLVDRDGNPAWRVSLQNPNASEQLNFADLRTLINYLEQKLREIRNQETKR